MPFVSPVVVIGLVVPIAVKTPGLDMTLYVMAKPPVSAGVVKLTVA